MAERGFTQAQMSQELGVSIPTLERRIADLQSKQGLLLKYRELQNLQLTSIQCRILEAITPDKIDCASLGELVAAFKILKDRETATEDGPQLKGLVGYLIAIEKKNMASTIAAEYTDTTEEEIEDAILAISSPSYMPAL